MPKVFDPLFDRPISTTVTSSVSEKDNNFRTNDRLVAASETPPISPISGEPMILVECGGPNRTILAWAHLKDRIVLPCRAN